MSFIFILDKILKSPSTFRGTSGFACQFDSVLPQQIIRFNLKSKWTQQPQIQIAFPQASDFVERSPPYQAAMFVSNSHFGWAALNLELWLSSSQPGIVTTMPQVQIAPF